MTTHPEGERVEITPELLDKIEAAARAVPYARWRGRESYRTHLNGHPHTVWPLVSDEDPGEGFNSMGVAVVVLPKENDKPADRKRCKAIAAYLPMAQPLTVLALVERIRALESACISHELYITDLASKLSDREERIRELEASERGLSGFGAESLHGAGEEIPPPMQGHITYMLDGHLRIRFDDGTDVPYVSS